MARGDKVGVKRARLLLGRMAEQKERDEIGGRTDGRTVSHLMPRQVCSRKRQVGEVWSVRGPCEARKGDEKKKMPQDTLGGSAHVQTTRCKPGD